MKSITWATEPKDTNYPAALSYLSLIFPELAAVKYVDALREADIEEYKVKDILRASGLPQLPKDNYHVQKNFFKIDTGHKISPILLVRDTDHRKVIIADGYHRVCAIHYYDEDADIHCKLISAHYV